MSSALILRQYEGHQIRQREDGTLSLTDMAAATGKRVNNYLRNGETDAFLKALEAETRIRATDLVAVVQGGLPAEQGTWAHPQVAMHFAYWASPKLQVCVTRWLVDLAGGKVSVDIHPSAPPTLTVEDIRAVIREEVEAHYGRGADRVSEARVYVTEFLASCFGGAPIDKGVKLEFRRLVKAAAERAGVDVWRCGSEGTDRLYVEARHAAVLVDAWQALRRRYKRLLEGVRLLPGIDLQEVGAKHQSKNP